MHIIQIDGGMPLEKKSCLTTVVSTHSSMTRNTLVLSSKTSRRATILGCFSLKKEKRRG